jgi:hypothetical protein
MQPSLTAGAFTHLLDRAPGNRTHDQGKHRPDRQIRVGEQPGQTGVKQFSGVRGLMEDSNLMGEARIRSVGDRSGLSPSDYAAVTRLSRARPATEGPLWPCSWPTEEVQPLLSRQPAWIEP